MTSPDDANPWLPVPPGSPQPPPPLPPPTPGYGWSGYGAPPPTSGKAVAAMVFGIIGLVGLCGFGLGVLPAILALVLGYQARSDIRASGGTLGGEGNAKAGIVMGWLAVGILVAAVVTVFGFAVAIDHANLG